MIAVSLAVTVEVVALKRTDADPDAMVTRDGTETAGFELAMVTAIATPVGWLRVRVQIAEALLPKVEGVQVSPPIEAGGYTVRLKVCDPPL